MIMKYFKIISMVVLTVFALSTIGCSEEEKYNTDYQWLALSQATEQWNGSACNKLITLQENQVTDTIIKLTVSLYQNQTASQDCTADVVVAKDSLSKAIALSEKGGIYDVYRNALLMSDEYFEISSTKVTLKAGETQSAPFEVTIHREKLLKDPVRTENENAIFVLPIQIVNSSSYKVNEVVNTLMLMFQLPQIDPTQPDVTDPKQEIDGMKLVWHDEFNEGTSLGNDWTHEVQGAGWVNNELQIRISGCWRKVSKEIKSYNGTEKKVMLKWMERVIWYLLPRKSEYRILIMKKAVEIGRKIGSMRNILLQA